jgi:D-alanyl-D-alanine carboxypeptidase
MRYSWHPGCPVPLEDLRLVSPRYWGFDGEVHTGELVVNEGVARDVVRVFGVLFRERFPIRRMVLVDEYEGDDDRSMAANNTSAFNCRAVTGGSAYSEHSYGWAIDINPVQNPYTTGAGTVLPPEGAAFLDRRREARGMIHEGDEVVRAFAAVGWQWGGSWSSIKDYQHFSATGK